VIELLRTKTSVPPSRPKGVRRKRLLERLEEGAQRGLTLVVAPAGFGKTTLVTEWTKAASIPAAWYSLDDSDRVPDRFLTYLIQSVQRHHSQVGQTALAIIQSRGTVGSEAILSSLVNDLSEISTEFAIVFDDYHSIENPEIDAMVQFLLEKRPNQLHLVIISRTMPDLRLGRLRALDQVMEITTDDLRFTSQEMQTFLEQVMSLHLSQDELAYLYQSTEGWAAGLQLAALAHTRQSFDWDSPATQKQIFDYLAEEVLRQEPAHVQDFLLRISLFTRFSIPLCDFLLDEEPPIDHPATELLAHIENANLFLVTLDANRTWFRFHALFADFLRQQLWHRYPDLVPKWYRATSGWFEKNDFLDDAIHYAVHAGDSHSTKHAAKLIGRHYRDMLLRGEQSALLEYLSELPPGLMTKHPRLWLAKGWANAITMNALEAARCAAQAEASIPDGELEASLRGEIESLRILAGIFQGQVIPEEQISKAFILLAEKDRFLHTILHFNLGMMHVLAGETAQALDDFQETLQLSEGLSNPLLTIFTWTQMGEQYQLRGELALAERAFQKCINYTRQTLGERTFLLGMPYVSYAELLREQNHFEEALRYAEQGITYCLLWQPTASLDGNIALARMRAGQGRWGEAFACFERALEVAEKSDTILDDNFVMVQLVRTHLLRGDLAKARQWMKTYDPEDDFGPGFHRMQEMASLVSLRADFLEAESDPDRASRIADELASLLPEIERRKRISSLIETLILQSYALHSAGQHTEAADSLNRALLQGADCGYVRLFADEGSRLMHLIDQYRTKLATPADWLGTIMEILRGESIRGKGSATTPISADLMPLTRRELDVLHLLADGKSNQEIATELVLALNTVKKHVANILGKLGVANRTQAVVVAKEKGWIGEK